jgi:hypothetical protein
MAQVLAAYVFARRLPPVFALFSALYRITYCQFPEFASLFSVEEVRAHAARPHDQMRFSVLVCGPRLVLPSRLCVLA